MTTMIDYSLLLENADISKLESSLLANCEVVDGVTWVPSWVPPIPNRLVMVTGSSGMNAGAMRKDKFLCLAYHDPSYRPPIDGVMRWLDINNDDLRDYGWRVEFWTMPIALPGRPA